MSPYLHIVGNSYFLWHTSIRLRLTGLLVGQVVVTICIVFSVSQGYGCFLPLVGSGSGSLRSSGVFVILEGACFVYDF